ncbi:MAG: ornithine carbamoyltransferase [Acidimicrobiia bacterium]
MRHFLEIDDLSTEELWEVLRLAKETHPAPVLAGQGGALLFEKPSLRTRNSMEMATVALGGHPISVMADEVGLDTRESVEDVTRTLAGYHAFIGARVFNHQHLERMVAVNQLPIVNLLSDAAHPMQALADLLTIEDHFGALDVSVAYIGDANNVARSLAIATLMTGGTFTIAAPEDYSFSDSDAEYISKHGRFTQTTSPAEAVVGAHVIYTDVWTSMGQEVERAARLAAFSNFTITETLLEHSAANSIFLHCLPAHRGEEVSEAVLEGERSKVWAQAENRMHAARGLLWWLMSQQKGA